jgi:iron(II)-dependent oxidoreductase
MPLKNCHRILIAAVMLVATLASWPAADETESQMVLIPAGEFEMGEKGKGDHAPVHTVYIDAFYMDQYEVTNAEYLEFCQDTDRQLPEFWGMDEFRSGPDFPNHPVIGVSRYDAEAYAKWADKRLPTEAEWEYAARGGLSGKKYPNGNDIDSSMANFTKAEKGGTVPVGSYPPNGFGLYDMAGNVLEWVADFYDGDYYSESPRENPTGPKDGRFYVIRGGGWHSGPSCNRVFWRNALPTGWVDFAVGFRCAKDGP